MLSHIKRYAGFYMGIERAQLTEDQEISEMLGGRISNQDEEDVEDELAALEAEMSDEGQKEDEELPSVPNARLPEAERRTEAQKRTKQPERQAMLAA